jgi:hypothetical protein
MYGETTTGGATLASVGLASGSIILTVIGAVLAGWALLMLFRQNSANRP